MATAATAPGKLRIAMIGQRGVPASYGGIERHVEELGARLAARGHRVDVYCRSNYVERERLTHRGMHLIPLRTVGTKHLDAIVHSGCSTVAALTCRPDVFHFHALGPGLFSPLARALPGTAVVQTIHGLDNEREKWGPAAQRVLDAGAWLSARVPHRTIVVSRALQAHYEARYGRVTTPITNGVTVPLDPSPAARESLPCGLDRGGYVLFVGRVVPEKAPDLLLEAFRGVDTDMKLVIVGGSSFSDEYVARVRELAEADPRVVLAGYAYGDELAALYRNAGLFVLPSYLEGLPLTLLEAISYRLPVVVSDIPPHLEVVGGDGAGHRIFSTGSAEELRDALKAAVADIDEDRRAARELSRRVVARHDWDLIADQTEELYRAAIASAGGRRC